MGKYLFAKESSYTYNQECISIPIIMYLFHQVWTFEVESFTEATWHSSKRDSAQSSKLNVNARWGRCGEDGHKRALTMVKTNGSHKHVANDMLCSSPAQ